MFLDPVYQPPANASSSFTDCYQSQRNRVLSTNYYYIYIYIVNNLIKHLSSSLLLEGGGGSWALLRSKLQLNETMFVSKSPIIIMVVIVITELKDRYWWLDRCHISHAEVSSAWGKSYVEATNWTFDIHLINKH